MRIKCAVEGCSSVFETEEPVSPNFKYICSGRAAYGDQLLTHTREQQVHAAGRAYNPNTDEADKNVHFQNTQFDKQLSKDHKKKPTTPQGEEIPNGYQEV